MIKIFLTLIFSISLFANSLSLYDIAFLVSKSTGKSVIFSKEVNQKIKIIVADTPVNYLPLFKQSLKSNGYQLKTDKTFFYVTVPNEDKRSDNVFSPISNLNSNSFSNSSNSPLIAPPPLVSSNNSNDHSISVSSNGSKIFSSPMFNSASNSISNPSSDSVSDLFSNKSSNKNNDYNDDNITFKTLDLVYLKASDLNDTLNFSGFQYSVSSNSKSIIFKVPEKKIKLFDNFCNSIKSLDILHEQITLKITVFDSHSDKLRNLGMSPLFNLDKDPNVNSKSVLGSISSGSLLTGSLVSSFYNALNALEMQGITSIKDTPTFLLSNNETLDFKSVLNVPFLDQNINVTSQSNTQQTSKITYKPVGFKVLITPNIVNDVVYLDFFISFENLINADLHPTTSEKSIKNKFSLKKGDLLVLAGISKNTIKNNDSGVPFFKDIPYINGLFSLDSKSTNDETFNISIEVIK